MRNRNEARASSAFEPAQDFSAHPLAALAVAFVLGVVGSSYSTVQLTPLVAFGVLSTLVTITALWVDRTRLATAFAILAMLFVGASLASIEKNKIPANQLRRLINEGVVAVGEPVELTGVLKRDPENAPQGLYLEFRVQSIRYRSIERKASGVVMFLASVPNKSIATEFDQLDLCYGARIRVMAVLERADSFRNPGVSSFTEYLDRKGYDATGFIKGPLLVERLENERVFLPLAWLYEWRRNLQTEIDARFSSETAGVLDAALLGNRYKLSRPTSERFRDGGTFHVLVISGLHITFLGGLVFLIARRFTKSRALQFLLAVGVLWGYSLAVGAEASVVRAALMFTVVILAPLLSRRASSLNALGITALALLAWRPSDLFDPSFQLTFVSVLAIVVFAWPLLEKMSDIGSWRPTRETPYPPACASWLRSLCESLFWSERAAQRELERANYSYKLFKTPLAGALERAHLQRLLRYAFSAIVVSVAVQLALLPLLVIYFHRLSFASLLLNIGVSLLMAVVAIVAVFALVMCHFSVTLAAPLISLTNALNWTMVHSVDPFASIGAASIRLPEYTGWATLVYGFYYVPLSLLAAFLSRWKPLRLTVWQNKLAKHRRLFFSPVGIVSIAMLAQALAIVLVVSHPFSAAGPSGKLRIDFLDVGQGDSTLVTFPDNTTLLIDGGGRPGPFQPNNTPVNATEGEETFERETRSIGEAVVSEYLWWRGLDHIDYVLATHADADHIDGLNDVARNFHVRAALVARTPTQDPEYSKLSNTLSREHIPIRLIGAGDVLQFGQATATVLSPLPSASPNAPSRNNDSIVLRLQLGDRVVLLTGDVEMAGENALLRARKDLRADVVKVAHHGSKTSSVPNFIAASQARFAVISVGQTSIFGHPNREVVEKWKGSGAQVLTTGNNGTITVITDGTDLKVTSYVGGRVESSKTE